MSTVNLATLLTIQDAAEILAVNERMVRRLIESRQIPFIKVGRHVRFRECDLQSAMQAWTVSARDRSFGSRR